MKTILVTGAGPGFGRAVAHGATLPLSVRRPFVTITARDMPHIRRG